MALPDERRSSTGSRTASRSRFRRRLAVTLGDPRGIGPEIVMKALRAAPVHEAAQLVLVGPRGTEAEPDQVIGDWNVDGNEAVAGKLAGLAIERAVEMALAGDVDGIVTAPIDKHALLAGGYDYPGHTEMLSAL